MGKPLYLTFFTAIQMSHSSEVKLRESASTCSAPAVLETKDDGSKIQLLTTMKIALISLLSMTY
jgi:hypothetical protein